LSLRWQLAFVGLSLLILPWLSWRFVAELDVNLHKSQLASSEQLGSTLGQALGLLEPRWRALRARPHNRTLLVPPFESEILLDGYSHDWTGLALPARSCESLQC